MTAFFNRSRNVFATFGAVLDVARAVEARRQPSANALKTLGIDAETFSQINFR